MIYFVYDITRQKLVLVSEAITSEFQIRPVVEFLFDFNRKFEFVRLTTAI